MTDLAAAASPWWWLGTREHDFVAAEIVGPDAVADLVAIRFDRRRLADREAAGIGPVTDALALRVLQACGNRVVSSRELAKECHVTSSGVRRALAVALESNALLRSGRGRYQRHPSWGPVATRLVAAELKLGNWGAAFEQAQAYLRWANASWVVLARTPPNQAVLEAERSGLGLAVLGANGRIKRLTRPRALRRPRAPWAALWASEQVLARAVDAGYSAARPVPTPRVAPASRADVAAANLPSA